MYEGEEVKTKGRREPAQESTREEQGVPGHYCCEERVPGKLLGCNAVKI